MDKDDIKQEDEALLYVKNNYKFIIENFCKDIPSTNGRAVSIFMAGSPGVGKTEFSKRLLENFKGLAVRIDPDEVRLLIPNYNGQNATLFQKAATRGTEKIHDYVLKKNKNFILDTTFRDYEKSRNNILRSIDKGRFVLIQYLYQDPKIAWEFTKKREEKEKRGIPVDFFIDSLFLAKENVDRIKDEFGNKVEINLAVVDYRSDKWDIRLNIEKIDNHLKMEYTKEDLKKMLC